ncbi:MAG TPA: hypothetical protein VM012_05315 [Flavitalea sp.]|nr:hypothetical protein [Flavitalea sp.]
MTIQQFQCMDEMEKLATVLEYGRLLAQNLQDEYRVFLYRIESFYVSMKYYLTNDQLKEIDTFSDVYQSVPHSRKTFIFINPAERYSR